MAGGALLIIGCGWIAQRHAAAARQLGIPFIVASRDLARARSYARRFGAVGAYGSYQEGLADSRAAAAILCTPHDRHLDDTRAALAAGKHVLVEKPIARTLEEADAMIGRAADAGRVLMVAENFHFMPAFRRVKALVDSGRLGELRELQLIARGFRRRSGWRLTIAASGGGALIDGGIHYVHLLRWWGGRVRRVFALAPRSPIREMEGEDTVTLLAELEGGSTAVLSNSLGAPGVPRFQWSAVTGARATCFADNRGRWVVVRGGGRPRVWFHGRDTRGHAAMLRTFHDAIVRGKADEMDGREGREDLALVLAAYRSIEERRAVEVSC